jgi:hypothetical protein
LAYLLEVLEKSGQLNGSGLGWLTYPILFISEETFSTGGYSGQQTIATKSMKL